MLCKLLHNIPEWLEFKQDVNSKFNKVVTVGDLLHSYDTHIQKSKMVKTNNEKFSLVTELVLTEIFSCHCSKDAVCDILRFEQERNGP